MIQKLDNRCEIVAEQIFTVFQNAYKVEAQLIGAISFPPLTRTIEEIKDSETQFYGFFDSEYVAAVIEVNIKNQCLEIDSLTVHPDYFRKGIAGRLIEYALNRFELKRAIVETAAGNRPAITLYQKFGFREIKQWIPSHGIRKVAMLFEYAQ